MEEMKSRFRRICVFCGSSTGKKSSYQEAAVQFGNELVEDTIRPLHSVILVFASSLACTVDLNIKPI